MIYWTTEADRLVFVVARVLVAASSLLNGTGFISQAVAARDLLDSGTGDAALSGTGCVARPGSTTVCRSKTTRGRPTAFPAAGSTQPGEFETGEFENLTCTQN